MIREDGYLLTPNAFFGPDMICPIYRQDYKGGHWGSGPLTCYYYGPNSRYTFNGDLELDFRANRSAVKVYLGNFNRYNQATGDPVDTVVDSITLTTCKAPARK